MTWRKPPKGGACLTPQSPWTIGYRVIAHQFWIGLAGGAIAFAHCLGMCGGFALYLSQPGSRFSVLKRQAFWHLGRATTYVFLGSLAGFAGQSLLTSTRLGSLQNALAYLGGGAMILLGLGMLGLLPTLGSGFVAAAADLFAPLLKRVAGRPTPGAAFALGMGTGFLPCPIVLAFLMLSVQSGSVPGGMATMAGVAVGTAWSLLLLALTGQMFSQWLRRWAAVTAGVVLLLLGTATILRGTEVFHRLLGCEQQASPCCCEPVTP